MVPDCRASTVVSIPGSSPPHPSTMTVAVCSSVRIEMPSDRRPSIIAAVSSANSTPSSVVSPSAIAAATSARLVRLFDPGSAIVASGGVVSGSIGNGSGRVRGSMGAITQSSGRIEGR